MFEEILIRSIRKTGRTILIGAVIVMAVGILWYIGIRNDPEFSRMPRAGQITSLIFIALFLVLGLWMIYAFVKKKMWSPQSSRVYKAMKNHGSDDVVWIYEHVIQTQAPTDKFDRHSLYFCFSDKTVQNVMIKVKDLDAIFKDLEQHFPRATIGFSPELQKKYKENPGSLLKNS